MLVYFKVGNYKSIKEPVVINFTAAAISEHQDSNVLKKGKDNLLRSVLLYGPNAGGKSKILDALVFMRWLVINSATKLESNEKIETDAFALNTSSASEPSFFEAEFIVDKTKYRYGFEADEETVSKEWLLEVKATTEVPLFLRIDQEFEIDNKRYKDGRGLEKRTRKNALFLSVSAQWNVLIAEEISAWFRNIYAVHGLMDLEFRAMSIKMLQSEDFNSLINSLIRKADLGIQSMHALDLSDSGLATSLITIHEVYDDEGKVVSEIPFLLDTKESEGTRKFFNLAGIFIDSILKGRLLVIDELDARLHTLLSKAIISLYNSKELHTDAQLLAVSHDTALLDKDLLRRDQIYFVEKDNLNATKVGTLVEYKARKETPYYKSYLEGKYGAIPFVENLETILNNDKEK